MKFTLAGLIAAAGLAAWAASSVGAEPVQATGPIVISATVDVKPAYVTSPGPGYIRYAESTAPLPGPNCYWTRMPVYDLANALVGWRGRPVAVCP
jgi:hypothetical protein